MAFFQPFGYHCRDTTFRFPSYMSIVLMEKGLSVTGAFQTQATRLVWFFFFPFCSILFASRYGLGEKCLVPILHFSVRILGNIASVERKSYKIYTRRHSCLFLSSTLWIYITCSMERTVTSQ